MNYDIDYFKDEIHCLYEEKKELQKRIDNAIEYLKSRKDDNSMCSVCSVMTDELLDILKGSNTNVKD